MSKIGVLILAAGASRRMGVPKQLLPWKNDTLLGHTIVQAQKVTTNVFVVLGANAETIDKTIPENVITIINDSWERGMGTSISFGVKHIAERTALDALLVMTTDQPLIDYPHLSKVVEAYKSKKDSVVATAYAAMKGVPAIFPHRYFDRLMTLNKDYGAQKLLNDKDKVVSIFAGKKTVDLDTIKDYKMLYELHGK